jgi:hypothetical protein
MKMLLQENTCTKGEFLMKQSVVKSTLAVTIGLGLIGSAAMVDAQTLRVTHAYSDAAGNASAAPTNFATVYAARITGAEPFEIRSVALRVFFAEANGAPTSFEVPQGRTTDQFVRTFNAGPDGTDLDNNPLTDRFGVANPVFSSGGGFPLATNDNTIPASWEVGAPSGGAFEPVLVIGYAGTAPLNPAFGLTGNPPTSSGFVVRPPGSTVTGSFVSNANTLGLGNTEGGTVLAVEMVDMAAKQVSGGVLVSWETGLEIDNAGFNVYSAPATAQSTTKLNPILIGAAGTAASYSFMDSRPLAAGETRAYYVEDVEVNGLATTLHGPVTVTGGVSSNVQGWDLY